MNAKNLRAVFLLMLLPIALGAQVSRGRDVVPLKTWPAPLYWQPSQTEAHANAQPQAAGPSPAIQGQSSPLVFVAMTPCRMVDTRGPNGTFGGPILAAGSTTNYPIDIQSGNPCPVPPNALAYSLNVTVVPSGFLGFVTIWPQGLPQPTVSTLNDGFGQVLANAAIVPAGAPDGGVSVFVLNTTHLIIDINGVYMTQNAITLSQGSPAAPAINFTGDSATGIYSPSQGAVGIANGGTVNVTVAANGNVGIGTTTPQAKLEISGTGADNAGSSDLRVTGTGAVGAGITLRASGSGGKTYSILSTQSATGIPGSLGIYDPSAPAYRLVVGPSGKVGIGASTPAYLLDVNGFSTAGGPNANLDQQIVGSSALLDPLKNTGKFLVGWNWDSVGETDLISNRGSGTSGGFSLLDIGNDGSQHIIASLRPDFIQINGISGAGIPGGQTVLVNAAGAMGTINSSRRYKEDIANMDDASSGLMRLRPVTFRYKQPAPDGSKPLDYGLIAEEVDDVYPDLVLRNKEGEVQTVQYHKLTPMLLNEVQKQHRQIEKLQEQEETIRQLKERLAALEAALASRQSGAGQ